MNTCFAGTALVNSINVPAWNVNVHVVPAGIIPDVGSDMSMVFVEVVMLVTVVPTSIPVDAEIFCPIKMSAMSYK